MRALTVDLTRAEERDLVDLLFFERHGLKTENAFRPALEKDGGCTPAALEWVLAVVAIPCGIELPGGVSASEIRQFVGDLVVRLRRAAFAAPEAPQNQSPEKTRLQQVTAPSAF